MTDYALILSKLEEQDKKLDKIELAVVQMAVQGNQITNLQAQVDALFKKYDEVFKSDGALATLSSAQAVLLNNQINCSAKTQIKNLAVQTKILWVTIVGAAVSLISTKIGG